MLKFAYHIIKIHPVLYNGLFSAKESMCLCNHLANDYKYFVPANFSYENQQCE